MHKQFVIDDNQELIDEAKKLLERSPTDYVDRLHYHSELSKMLNKIFEYKEQTFSKVDDFIYNSPYYDNTATVVLNVDLENIINKIFKRQIELFEVDKSHKEIKIKRK